MNKKNILTTAIVSCALLAGCSSDCSNCKRHKPNPTETTKAPMETQEHKKVTLPSGLSYEVIKSAPANAQKPVKGQNAVVHYTGWLTNGEKFDSSVDRGQPFVFRPGMGMVIKGWDEGVALMAVGDKWKFTIPSELAYGNRAVGGKIPANSTLVFEVELLGVA